MYASYPRPGDAGFLTAHLLVHTLLAEVDVASRGFTTTSPLSPRFPCHRVQSCPERFSTYCTRTDFPGRVSTHFAPKVRSTIWSE
jgi:hypothetical protein